MAGKGTISAKIALEGGEQYKKTLKEIKQAQSELRSEMKLNQAEFKNSQNTITALQSKYTTLSKQVEQSQKKYEVYTKALGEAQEKQKKASESVDTYTKKLEEENKKLEELKTTSGTTNEELEEQIKIVEETAKALEDSNIKYEQASKKVSEYQTSVNYAGAELAEFESEQQKVGKYLKEAENSVDGVAHSIDEYGNEVDDAKEKTSTFGDVLLANLTADAIIDGAKKIVDAVLSIASACIETGAQFEASMSQVAATMGMTSDEVANGSAQYEMLASAARKMGAETMFSASQAADALNYLALAGYDADKAVATLPKVLTLAAAGGMELAYASDLVTDSMSALGMETDDLDMYIDQMAKSAQKSNTSVSQLGEATLVCAGAVAQVNMPLETMNAALGVLANNGLKGAEGGTHLRNAILSLTAPTDKASDMLEHLGVAVADSQGNMRDLENILNDLSVAMEGMGDVQKAATIKTIFNKTDIGAVNALLKSTTGEFQDLRQEILDSNGAAQTMADTMQDNLQGKITILQSALEGLKISFYDVFDEGLKTAVDSASNSVSTLTKAIEYGDLGTSLDKLGKSFGTLAEGVAQLAESDLPEVIDDLTWILDHAEEIGAIWNFVEGGVSPTKNLTDSLKSVKKELSGQSEESEKVAKAFKTTEKVYQDNKKAIDELTESERAEQGVALAQERLTEIVKERQEAQEKLAEAQNTLNEYEEKWYKMPIGATYNDAKDAVASYSETINGLNSEYNTVITQLQEYGNQQVAVNEIVSNSGVVYNEFGNVVEESLSGITKAEEELMNAYFEAEQTASKTLESQTGLFKEFSLEVEQSIGDISKNLESQTTVMTQFAEDLKWASEYANKSSDPEFKEIVSNIETMGVDGAGYLHELVEAAKTDSKEFKDLMKEWSEMQEAKDNLATTMAEFETGFSLGTDNILNKQEEFEGSFEESNTELLDNTEQAVNDATEAVETRVSDSLDTVKETVVTKDPEVATAVENLALNANEKVETTMSTDTWFQFGANAVQGLIDGLDSKLSELETKAVQVATTANKAVSGSKGLKENSPSKLWKQYGVYAVQGLELGFKQEMGNAQNVIYDMVDGFNDVVDFSQKDNSKLTTNPTAYAYQQQISYSDSSNPLGVLEKIQGVLNEYLPQINEMGVYIDKNTLVGQIAPSIDKKLGSMQANASRGM